MSINQRINALQEFFDLNPKGKMNSLQVLEHYRALHPCVDQPLNISFVSMILGYTKILSNCKNIPIVIWPNLSSIDNKQFLWMSEFAPVRNDVLIGWKPLP